MADFKQWETYITTGNPVVGANVTARLASDSIPNANPSVATTVTNASGMWEFTGLANAAHDFEVTFAGKTKLYKGNTKFWAALLQDTAFSVPGANLLRNGGQDNWSFGSSFALVPSTSVGTCDGWFTSCGAGDAGTVSAEGTTKATDSANGTKIVYTAAAGTCKHFQTLMPLGPAHLSASVRGRQLYVTAQIRQGVANNVRLLITDAAGTTGGSTVATTGSFQTISVTKTIDASTVGPVIAIQILGSDTVYIDNVMATLSAAAPVYAPTPSEHWLTPPGAMLAWPGLAAAVPAGWLLCDGSAVSRTTYAELFRAIGTGYGAGDGSTTFNLPDTRGRQLVGVDSGASRMTSNNTLGASGGTEGAFGAHNHSAGTLASVMATESAHTHAGGTLAMTTSGASAGHTHGVSIATQVEADAHTHTQQGSMVSGVQSASHTHTQQGTLTSGSNSVSHTHTQQGTITTSAPKASHFHGSVVTSGAVQVVQVGTGMNVIGNLITGTSGADSPTHAHDVVLTGATTTQSANHTHDTALSGATTNQSADHTHTTALSGATTNQSANHNHLVSGNTAAMSADHTHTSGGLTGATGAGSAHTHTQSSMTGASSTAGTTQAMDPFLVVHYIIKY